MNLATSSHTLLKRAAMAGVALSAAFMAFGCVSTGASSGVCWPGADSGGKGGGGDTGGDTGLPIVLGLTFAALLFTRRRS